MPAALDIAPPAREAASASRDTAPVARDADPAASRSNGVEALDLDPSLNPIIARPYAAATRGLAAMLYSKEAPALSKLGYVPASERWEEAFSNGYGRGETARTGGTLWVTYLAKSITLPPRVCSLCGSELPA